MIHLLLPLGQTPGVPHGGASCQTAADCSLGGTCTASVCACDPWWTGPTCALANLQPPNDMNGGLCGPGFASYYSWGGRALKDPSDGTWHLYASFMCGHQNLGKWTTDSSSAHFVGKTPTGAFEWAAEECDAHGVCAPTIPPWSHNTVPIVTGSGPGAAPPDEAWQIWHIGDGIVNRSVWAPCFNKSEVGPPREAPVSERWRQ